MKHENDVSNQVSCLQEIKIQCIHIARKLCFTRKRKKQGEHFHRSALEFSQTFTSVFTTLWRHREHVLFLNLRTYSALIILATPFSLWTKLLINNNLSERSWVDPTLYHVLQIKATLYPKFWWIVKKLRLVFELEEFWGQSPNRPSRPCKSVTLVRGWFWRPSIKY